jgi:ribosomal protein L11 methyltransferase
MNEPRMQHVLTLEAPAGDADALALRLAEEYGVQPVTLEKPGCPVAWIEIYYASANEAERARRALGRRAPVRAAQVRTCAPRDWLAFWRHHFRRHDVGASLRICPVWEKAGPGRGARKVIRIDPGASFGTGEHFTTRFCLEMIDRLCQKSGLRSLLDVGTGSGILAIAAARLGCRRAVGIDTDELALAQARRNVARNRVGSRVRLRVQDIAQVERNGLFEVVCANIIGAVLVDHAPSLARVTRRHLILSGIREFEADGVADAYQALGGREVVRDGDGEWAGMMFESGAR